MRCSLVLISVLLLSGCFGGVVKDVVETGSKSYKTISDANSLGNLAKGVNKLAETRKIKAQTQADFIAFTNQLITNQPIEKQPALITDVLRAKVEIAKNTRYLGWLEMLALIAILTLVLVIMKYVFNRFKPKVKSATYE